MRISLAFLLRVAALAPPTAIAVVVAVAAARDYRAGSIVVGHPWARPTAGAATPGAGYMTLDNRGPADDRLVSASSPAAEAVTMHRTEVRDGVAGMRPQEGGIAVPAGGTVRLEPGGYHLMLERLRRPLALGETVPVSLTFAKAGTVTVDLKVERRPAAEDAGHDTHQAPPR